MIMEIQSMTGYGTGSAGNFRVEVRSTNHRNIDIRIKVPSYLYSHEPDIRKMVRERFQRGRIEILVPKIDENNIKLIVNKPLAREYYNALVSIKEDLSMPDEIGIDAIARKNDIFTIDDRECNISDFQAALESALEDLGKMRREEGSNLSNDISERVALLNELLTDLESKRDEFIAGSRNMLTEKLQSILSNTQIDESRIIQETAILVERSDISEEIVRLRSHLGHMMNLLGSGDVKGKKLDFLSQELHREVNTIGSKAANAGISELVVDMKYEIEKIREQAQNIQ
jgi:uncharacterized protein (TIGR00255 family)